MLVKYIPGLMRDALSNRKVGFLVAAALGRFRMTDAGPKVHSWLGAGSELRGLGTPALGRSWDPPGRTTKTIPRGSGREGRRRKMRQWRAARPPTPGVCTWTQGRLRPESKEGPRLPADRAHGRLILGDQGGERPEGLLADEQRKRGICVQVGCYSAFKRKEILPFASAGMVC